MRADLCRLALQPDLATFSNPYADSWIFHSSPEQHMNTVPAGIAIMKTELPLPVRLTGKHAVSDAAGMAMCRSLSLLITACPG